METKLILKSVFLTLLIIPTVTTAIPTTSIDTVQTALRSNGHSLLANAISTSDLLFDILNLHSFTLLAPPDPSLFALDMTHSPPFYLSSLRCHIIPSFTLLSNSTSASTRTLPTLLPSCNLRVSVSRHHGGDLLLDGIQVVFPELYRERNAIVYRLRSILPSRVSRDLQFDNSSYVSDSTSNLTTAGNNTTIVLSPETESSWLLFKNITADSFTSSPPPLSPSNTAFLPPVPSPAANSNTGTILYPALSPAAINSTGVSQSPFIVTSSPVPAPEVYDRDGDMTEIGTENTRVNVERHEAFNEVGSVKCLAKDHDDDGELGLSHVNVCNDYSVHHYVTDYIN